jgi:hypothetical protein
MLVAQTFHTFTPALTQKAHQETSIRGFCSCAIPPTSDWRQQGDFVLILHKRLDAFLVDVFLCYRVLLPPPLACLLYVVIVLVLLLSVISSSVDCCALPRLYATGGKKRPDWMFSFVGIGWSGTFSSKIPTAQS